MLHAESAAAAPEAGGAPPAAPVPIPRAVGSTSIMGGGKGAALTALAVTKNSQAVTGSADGMLQARVPSGAGLRQLLP
jgi:hypothetical protein